MKAKSNPVLLRSGEVCPICFPPTADRHVGRLSQWQRW